MTHPTQPSSTPITAEGAVLRDLPVYKSINGEYCVRLADVQKVIAAIQPAGEVVRGAFLNTQGGVTLCQAGWEAESFGFVSLLHRAPQDAKAEQVGYFEQQPDGTITPVDPDDYTPAASNVEAGEPGSIATNHDAMIILTQGYEREAVIKVVDAHTKRQVAAALGRQSAPIEAGELPPLPEPSSHEMGLDGYIQNFSAKDMRAYGRLCRDTATKPASTASTASIGDDAEFKKRLAYLENAETYEYRQVKLRELFDYIDARQSVAAPDSLQMRALAEENRQLTAKVNEWRDKHTESEEARMGLLAAFNREVSGDTFMGEPVLPPRPDVSAMVNRFLGWRLPDTFSPDCGISFDGRKDDEWNKNKTWPTGTNLLTAIEAKAMFEHCAPVQGKASDAEDADDDHAEGLEILDDLIRNIEDKGNYSKEATITFLSQIRQCFAARAQQQGGVA